MNKNINPNKSKTKSKTLEENMHREQCKQLKILTSQRLYDYKLGIWKGYDANNTHLCT